MLDEEGYMTLEPRAKAGNSMSSSRNSKRQDNPARSRKYKIALWILGTSFAITGTATIVLSVFIFQGTLHNQGTSEALNCTVGELSRPDYLRERCPGSEAIRRLCGPPTESSECKLCPANWLLRSGRCYWFSLGTDKWLQAQDHCSSLGSRLLVIKDSGEKAFIQKNIEGEYRFWIGLKLTYPLKKWTWVDGSLFSQTSFSAFLSPDGNSCGVIKVSQVRSEMCTDEFKWICEMEAILI